MSLVAACLSWIFRPQCAACGAAVASGLPFCPPCSVALLENLVCCPACAEMLVGSRAVTCVRCRRRPLPLHKIVAPWQYGGSLAEAIVRMKFGRHAEIARTLAPLVAPVLVATACSIEATMIVPVPLHWSRRLVRGFDQSRQLLHHAQGGAPSPCPVVPALRRLRATPYQSRADAAGRARNMAAAIAVAPPWRRRLAGARVVLFDDVVTTGATMAACARALRSAGAAQVVGVALARGGTP